MHKRVNTPLLHNKTYWLVLSRDVWDVELAKEAVRNGINEIQFDYVRLIKLNLERKNIIDFRNEYNEEKVRLFNVFNVCL